MKSIFELTQPRPEVLQGELSEEMFAARLKDVMGGSADPVYGDPYHFFSNTYPTDGLRTLLREVLGRLTGESPTNNPIIRLETSFGGGKTHNLIALYHVASGGANRSFVQGFVQDSQQLPTPGAVDIAGVVGSDLDPMTGIYHAEDSVTTYTLWGELAYQLGGRAGYALAQQSDVERTAPGTGLFERLIGTRPTLIMIDEIARHLRAAVAVPTPSNKSNLSEQTVAFLMSLMEFVSSQRNVVLVLTMAGEEDAFSKETSDLREALRVSARQERVLTPSGENEISSIVVHRLFAEVDRDGAQQVISRYGAYYRELEKQDAAIHSRALRADYIKEFELAYPFHPELIRVLNLKVATIPNFQRTRGALRLLASVVRRIWANKTSDTWLIHPYNVDLGYDPIVEELSSRLDRSKFKQVSEADIVSFQVGIPAHAAHADELLVAAGRPPYARRLGTTVFLHSLTQGIASGVEVPELMLATLTPAGEAGDDPAIVHRALEGLYSKAWFLEFDGFRYRFKTEPSLNKIIDDETSLVTTTRAKQEIDDRLRSIWKPGFLKPVFFPVTPADVDDDAEKPKLAIIHYDALRISAGDSEPPEMIRRMAEVAGLTESFRNYQNNVLFLVADADQVEEMVKQARRYLAIDRITSSVDRMRSFNDEQQKKLRETRQDAELQIRVAITKAYRYIFYPTSEASKSNAFLQRETMTPQAQGDTNTDQINVVVRTVHSLKKILRSDDSTLSAKFVKSRAWDRQQTDMSTDDLRRAFARKVTLPILLDINQLVKTIDNGIKTSEWVYYDTTTEWAYDAGSPPTHWEIGERTRLYLPEEAARLNLRIKGKWQPPQTTQPMPDVPSLIDDEPEGLDEIIGNTRPAQIVGQGPVMQAFQQVHDACEEHGATAVSRLTLSLDGTGRPTADALANVGLAIPQLGKARFGIRLKMSVQFDPPPGEMLSVEFQGGWDRYKRMKQVTDAFAREEAHSLNISLSLTVDYERAVPLDDPQFITAREVLSQLVPGSVKLTAIPVYSE